MDRDRWAGGFQLRAEGHALPCSEAGVSVLGAIRARSEMGLHGSGANLDRACQMGELDPMVMG
jgi:hypothetical protein